MVFIIPSLKKTKKFILEVLCLSVTKLSLCGKILPHTFVCVEEVRSHFLAPKLVSLSDYSHPDSLETVS